MHACEAVDEHLGDRGVFDAVDRAGSLVDDRVKRDCRDDVAAGPGGSEPVVLCQAFGVVGVDDGDGRRERARECVSLRWLRGQVAEELLGRPSPSTSWSRWTKASLSAASSLGVARGVQGSRSLTWHFAIVTLRVTGVGRSSRSDLRVENRRVGGASIVATNALFAVSSMFPQIAAGQIPMTASLTSEDESRS